MTDPGHPLNVQNRLQQLIDSKSKMETHDFVHVYVFATKWKNEFTVEIRVAEDYLLSDNRKKLPLEQIPIEARTTYYDWDVRLNSLIRTKQTMKLDFSGDH
jgi:light-regulated signal transduction histidine kinase (bacteriophytochrome)